MRIVPMDKRHAPMSASAVSLLLHGGAVLGLLVLSSPHVTHRAPSAPLERLVYVPPAPSPAPRALPPSPPPPPRAANIPAPPAIAPPEIAAPAFTPSAPVAPSDMVPAPPTAPLPLTAPPGATAVGVGAGDPSPTTGSSAETPTVWEGERVDQTVKVRRAGPAPRYPASLQAIGMEANLVARFIVDTTGRVRPGSIEIVPLDTPSAFQQAVIAHLTGTTYHPARAGGRVVPQWVEQAFAFTMRR